MNIIISQHRLFEHRYQQLELELDYIMQLTTCNML